MAGVFARRGVDAWVFRGDDGLDELTTTTTSQRLGGHAVARSPSTRSTPPRLGIPRGTAEGLRGQDAAYNAEVVRRLLAGEPGPVRDAVLLNAGAALAVHAARSGLPGGAARAGIARATEAVDSGAPPARPSSAGSPRRRGLTGRGQRLQRPGAGLRASRWKPSRP